MPLFNITDGMAIVGKAATVHMSTKRACRQQPWNRWRIINLDCRKQCSAIGWKLTALCGDEVARAFVVRDVSTFSCFNYLEPESVVSDKRSLCY